MGDESGSLEGKSLSNLRVVDLKMELEKRGLSKSGSKKELVKRLKQKLELEKLYEESSAIGESEPKLQLDEATEQNEFVKQYLAQQQQQIYARQEEVRRLIELKEKEESGGTDDSDSGLKDQDSDVSEGVSLSKTTCDSSAVVEGEDHDDDKETPALQQESESDAAHVTAVDPVNNNQENLCDSTNSPNQESHERVEPSDIPVEMESKSGDTVAFSLMDISLPESPKMPVKSGSKSPRNKSDKLPLKTSSYQAGSLVHEQANIKTNGSVSKISKSGRWQEDQKIPSAETDKISDSTEHGEQVAELSVQEERFDKNLSKDGGDAAVNKEVKKNVDSLCKLEAETSLEDLKRVTAGLVEKTSISNAKEIEKRESNFPVPETSKSDPDQVMEISESSTSRFENSVKTDNLDNERRPIGIHKTKPDSDNDVEMPVQSRWEKIDKLLSKTKILKRRERSSRSSSSSSSRNSSPDRKKNRSPELRERTDSHARHRRDRRHHRGANADCNRSPDLRQKGRSTKQKGSSRASRSKSPDARQRFRDTRRKKDRSASSSPDKRRSRSPIVRHRDQDTKKKRGQRFSRSKSPDGRHKNKDTKFKRETGISRNRSPDTKHKDRDTRRRRRDSASRSRSPDKIQKDKDTRRKRLPGASWSKSPEIRRSKISDINRSRSPAVSRSKSPAASRSKSPAASRSKSPAASRSKSPAASRSKSPAASRSKSPAAGRGRSPVVGRSKSPDISRSRSSDISRSRSPEIRQSKSPEIRQSKSPEIRQSRSTEIRQSRSPEISRSKSPEIKRSRSPKIRQSKSPEIGQSSSPDEKQSKNQEAKQSSDADANETTSPVLKQTHRPKRKQSISPKRKQSISPKRRHSLFTRRSSSPSFRPNTGSEMKQSSKFKESISPDRKSISPDNRQSISPQKKQIPSPGKSRNSSPEVRYDSPEVRSDRKRKNESRKSFLDNLSDSSSDSDRRESKRVTSMRNTMSQEKQIPTIERSRHVFEKKDGPEPRQPKRPKLNRSSFSMPETAISNANRKRKEVSSSDSNATFTEEKNIVMSEDMMTQEEPTASADLSEMPSEKISFRKLNVPFRKQTRQDTDIDPNSGKKRRWRSSSNMLQTTGSQGMNISSDSLKHLIPDFKLTPTSVPSQEMEEVPIKAVKGSEKDAVVSKFPAENDDMVSKEENDKEVEASKVAKTKAASSSKISKQKKAIKAVVDMLTPTLSAFSSALDATIKCKKPAKKPGTATAVPSVKKEEPVKKETEKRKSSVPRADLPSESSKPVVEATSCIVFVQNLVRPFTTSQLVTLLNQTGTIVKDGFWIDKIKSKCFVKYQNEEEATKTKEALHDARWPPTNPKILSVQFATQEEFDLYSKGYDVPNPSASVAPQPDMRKREREASHEPGDLRKRRAERHSREREHSRQIVTYVREWDKDKLTQESPEREPVRPPRESHRNRSSERKKDSKKGDSKKKSAEDTPAKLLDDLFQKTKNTPCIYWLPLTEEQVKTREDERRQRRLDREKRNKLEREQEEAERRAKRKPREKESRSRSRSRQGRRR